VGNGWRPVRPSALAPHVGPAATYDLAATAARRDHDGDVELDGAKISRFTHLFWSVDDLIKKIAMLRFIGGRREPASSGAWGSTRSTLSVGTYDIDQAKSTDYQKRFRNTWPGCSGDLMSAGAMTTPRGPVLAPWQQADPTCTSDRRASSRRDRDPWRQDAHHRCCELHEIIVMPTLGLPPEGADYAVACACRSTPRAFARLRPSEQRRTERGGRNVRLRNGVGGGRGRAR